MGEDIPDHGVKHSGDWKKGNKDAKGTEITPSHKNARYTVPMKDLANADEKRDDPNGLPLGGIIYGGRDDDTWVPVFESIDWNHGVITVGGSLESKTTAATLGAEGVRAFNIMANMDFVSRPLGSYLQSHIDFAKDLKEPPKIFATNYFLEDKNGKFLNSKLDKGVWLQWAERRIHGDVEAIETPIGRIPKYEDLKPRAPFLYARYGHPIGGESLPGNRWE